MSRTRSVTRTALGLAAAATIFVACSDDKKEMSVLDPGDSVDGSSVADLLRDYTRNWATTPADDNMLVDPSKCDMGKSTDAVYFAPTFGAPGETTASCTMKASQTLFLLPVGVTCFEDAEEKADEACLDKNFNLTSSAVTIDGEPVEDLSGRLVEYEPEAFDLPEGNLLEVPAGSVKTIGRGQVVLVDGLAEGEHEVVLAGDFGDGEFAGSLTITLTVE